jgi:hypothetical protein
LRPRFACSTAGASKATGGPRVLVFVVAKQYRWIGPEGGVATARFLVLQQERGRYAVLGPRAIGAQSGL